MLFARLTSSTRRFWCAQKRPAAHRSIHVLATLGLVCFASFSGARAAADAPAPSPFAAHNAYTWRLYGDQRLPRALAADMRHIEIDISYDAKRKAAVVTHDAKPLGSEPELGEFLAPVWEKWSGANLRGCTLILDCKSSSDELAQAIAAVLAPHAERLTSLPKKGGALVERAITVCLTGDTSCHERYAATVSDEGSYLAFGDKGGGAWLENAADYVPSQPAGFLRFVTLPRSCFQDAADAKGDEHVSEERMRAVVDACNARGYRLRIYSYNPATSRKPIDDRAWSRAVAARVHMIATDAYEAAQTWWNERGGNE